MLDLGYYLTANAVTDQKKAMLIAIRERKVDRAIAFLKDEYAERMIGEDMLHELVSYWAKIHGTSEAVKLFLVSIRLPDENILNWDSNLIINGIRKYYYVTPITRTIMVDWQMVRTELIKSMNLYDLNHNKEENRLSKTGTRHLITKE